MKTLITVTSFALLFAISIAPFFILVILHRRKIKYKVMRFLISSITVTALLTLTFAWWSDTANEILLSHYRYDFNAMDDTNRFSKVSKENMKRVEQLEISKMGIGWPIKAVIVHTTYAPYLLVLCLIVYLVITYRHKLRDKAAG